MSDRRALSALAMLKVVYADKQTPRLRGAVQTALQAQVRAFAAKVASGSGPDVLADFRARWETEIDDAVRRPLAFMGAHGFELGGDEIHGTAHAGKSFLAFGAKTRIAGVDVGKDDFIQKANWKNLDKFIRTTAESATETSGERLENIFTRASNYWDEESQQGFTPAQIAKEILIDGLAQTEARALMLAQTGSIFAYGEGAVLRYQADGVPAMEWLTADDDLRCPFCFEMNGSRVAPGDSFFNPGDTLTVPDVGTLKIPSGKRGFNVNHPPLHPHCRCTLIPIVDEGQLDSAKSFFFHSLSRSGYKVSRVA